MRRWWRWNSRQQNTWARAQKMPRTLSLTIFGKHAGYGSNLGQLCKNKNMRSSNYVMLGNISPNTAWSKWSNNRMPRLNTHEKSCGAYGKYAFDACEWYVHALNFFMLCHTPNSVTIRLVLALCHAFARHLVLAQAPAFLEKILASLACALHEARVFFFAGPCLSLSLPGAAALAGRGAPARVTRGVMSPSPLERLAALRSSTARLSSRFRASASFTVREASVTHPAFPSKSSTFRLR